MLEMDDILNDFVRAWQTFDADLIIKHLDEKFVTPSGFLLLWIVKDIRSIYKVNFRL